MKDCAMMKETPWCVAAWRGAWVLPFVASVCACYLCLLVAWGKSEADKFWAAALL